MQEDRSGAFATTLIVATALMFVTLLGHPAVGHGPSTHDLFARIYAARTHLGLMHAAAIAIQLTVITCLLAFCSRAGFHRPLVAFAAVAFSAASAGICVAGSFDGFLIPAFAGRHFSIGGAAIDMSAPIAAGAIVIQYSTKFAIALMAVAVVLLSLRALTMEKLKAVAVTGLVLAVVQGAALLALPVLTPHNVACSALPTLIWQLVLGIAWRSQRASRA